MRFGARSPTNKSTTIRTLGVRQRCGCIKHTRYQVIIDRSLVRRPSSFMLVHSVLLRSVRVRSFNITYYRLPAQTNHPHAIQCNIYIWDIPGIYTAYTRGYIYHQPPISDHNNNLLGRSTKQSQSIDTLESGPTLDRASVHNLFIINSTSCVGPF